MTEETNLQLNKLVESIDGVSGQLELLAENASNPDWWTIGITVVNALIMIWLGWKQYKLQQQQTKLQEQQTKQQEYSLYNRLYKLVKDMDFLITEHMSTSFYYYGALRGTAPVRFTEKKSQVSECIKELDYCWVDFELKFPQEKDVVEKYRFVLTEMRDIYHSLNNRVLFEKEENRDSLKIRKRCRRVNSEDDYELKEGLLSLLPRGTNRKYMDECLSRFLEDKEYLEKSNLLDKIAKHC